MKKGIFLFLLVSLLGFLNPLQIARGEEVIKLKMADSFPIGHFSHHAALYLIKRIDEFTKGKIAIEYYPSEQLGKLKDYLNLCTQGLIDIVYIPTSYFAGQIPLNNVMTLPFSNTAVEGTEIYIRLVDTCPELLQEWQKYGVRPITLVTTNQYDVGTVKKPVRSPEDLKGLKLKTAGGFFDKIAKRYGIIPVSITSPEVYEATQRGIVDGNIFSYTSVKGYRVNELEKFHTLGLRMGTFPFTYQINEKGWQKLPKDLQSGLMRAGSDYAKYWAENWDKQQIELAEQFEKAGMMIYRISASERAKWDAPLKGIEEEWIKDMEKRGLSSAKKIFLEYIKVCEEVVK